MPPAALTDAQRKTLELVTRIKMAWVGLYFALGIFTVFSAAFLASVFLSAPASSQAILGAIDGTVGWILKVVYTYLFPKAVTAAEKETPKSKAVIRGARRVLIVLSIVLMIAGIVLDAASMLPHATVQVKLRDGRQLLVKRHTTESFLLDQSDIQRAINVAPGECRERPDRKAGNFAPLDCAGDIVDVAIVKAPHYRWWLEAFLTAGAVGVVAVLWAIFGVIIWIVRGFRA